MENLNRGDRLKDWLINYGPQSIYWKKTGTANKIEKEDAALCDLHDILTLESEETISTYFNSIKLELITKAVKADLECEDQPVPRGWPEPTD